MNHWKNVSLDESDVYHYATEKKVEGFSWGRKHVRLDGVYAISCERRWKDSIWIGKM